MIVELAAGDISIGVVDNDAHPEVIGHMSGYNGLAWLTHAQQRNNLFVPTYAGMNLELYFDGAPGSRAKLFEPRSAPMTVERIDDASTVLHQPPTPEWQVESWTTFTVRAPHYVDFHFRAVPHADTFGNGWMGVFWASYINQPEDPALHLPILSDDDAECWYRHYSRIHGEDSTHLHRDDRKEIRAPEGQTPYMYAAYSGKRFARPLYYGVSHGMVYLFMAEDDPRVRFTQSPSGGGHGNPAWDYQLIVPDVVAGNEYEMRARVAYRPFSHISDIENEYTEWCVALSEK